ncbi:hypothetical protein [Shouchella miscanthi]|uniref:DUF3139 domain-containing protein n=1 Tax=Shouchella miscanthi TaxID=2598861 RepID=A0ABU6NJ24_9BACI|nr:hypothetical protein [Shouchella miscanthi]
MIKRGLIFTVIILTVSILVACGNSYDETIEQVLDWENEALSEPDVDKDFETLKRDQTAIRIFDDSQFVEITYRIRSDHTTTRLYDLRGSEPNRHGDMSDVENTEPEYEEGANN